jgi:hypothetical protein
MNKIWLLTMIIVMLSISVTSQNIAPDINTEFCPNQDILFTVTLPRVQNNTAI